VRSSQPLFSLAALKAKSLDRFGGKLLYGLDMLRNSPDAFRYLPDGFIGVGYRDVPNFWGGWIAAEWLACGHSHHPSSRHGKA
jgi:hypothetical protein